MILNMFPSHVYKSSEQQSDLFSVSGAFESPI